MNKKETSTQASERPKTLVLKLAQVMAETRWVEKKGRNNFFNYDYAKESDILDAVRTKLAEHGIFVFTSIEHMDFKETGKRTRDGSPVHLVFVRTKHTFWDGESGETAEVFGSGSGEDAGDKAIYKAITGAMKYFISKNFLISTGDDPERDEDGDKKERVGQGEKAVPGPADRAMGGTQSSISPIPQFEPISASPTPLAPSNAPFQYENPARDLILDIQSKSGPKKDGSTYTRYSIETRNNGFFTTFNRAFADLAMDAKNAGQEVVIRYKTNGRWKDIESIRLAEGGYVSPALSETEAEVLPF
ncbi:MAG TPA: ERF family protein [Fibrobacteria bacterium]|nr:ERF family protein [Fibrobacteria bacterium]